MKKIVFAEGNNEIIRKATERSKNICEPLLLNGDLVEATKMVANGDADAIIAGLDHTSRDVILAIRDNIGMRQDVQTFSGMFVCDMPDGRRYIIADGAACKNPTTEQLIDIVTLVSHAAKKLLTEEPRIAMLSFSTFGSGGNDASIDKIHEAVQLTREQNPELLIDGEMQLDAAIDSRIAQKKGSNNSPVAGQANILITPEINSGNILVKAIEQFGGAIVAGPILLGFKSVTSDMSRGMNLEDAILTIKCVVDLLEH